MTCTSTLYILCRRKIYVHIAQNTVHLLPKPSYPWHVIYACELSESARLRALSHSSSSVYSFVDFVSFAHLCLSTWLSVHKISFGKKTFPSQLYFGGELIALFHPIYFFRSHIDTHIFSSSFASLSVCLSVSFYQCILLHQSSKFTTPTSTSINSIYT